MNRREIFAGAGALAGLAWTLAPHSAQAQAAVAGTDYIRLDQPAPVEAPAGQVEVVEFFWYNCPHCNAFEPTLTGWLKKLPKYAYFRRVPVAFNDSFAPQQHLYYALEAMGLVEQLHDKVFAAIHGQKLNLSKGPAIIDWVVKQGVDKAKFIEQFNSFSVATKSARATQLQNEYRVAGVPALGVAGRYYTDADLTKSMNRSLQVVEFLMAEAHAGR